MDWKLANWDQILGFWLDPDQPHGRLLIGVLIILIAWIASRALGWLMNRAKVRIQRVVKGIDETAWRLLIRLKTILVFLIALAAMATIIPGLKTIMNTLLAGAGVTAIVIGFAAKSTLSNLISGLSLAIYRPISIGDAVEIEGYYGKIEDITLRHTILLTWEQKRIVIPNEKLDNMTLVNYSATDSRMMIKMDIGVSYDTDIDLARKLILDEAGKCPYLAPKAIAPDPPTVYVVGYADSSITLRFYGWAGSVADYWMGRYWIFEKVKKRFDAEGVEIPFPYRTVVYKNELPPAPRLTPDEAEPAQPAEPEGLVESLPPDDAANRRPEHERMWRRMARMLGRKN